jgi:hypothetical protein
MKALWCVVLACLTVACSSHSKTFVVQDRSGETMEFSSLRYYTAGNVWDTGRGSIPISIPKGSFEVSKNIPRDFDGIESIEILEGSGENLSDVQKGIKKAEVRKLEDEYEKTWREHRENEEIDKALQNRNEAWAKETEQKPALTNTSPPVSQPPAQKSRVDEMRNRIAALKDSLKDLKIRVTYTSGETFEGTRKRDDWQNEDYIYGTTKDSNKSVRLDIAKVRSIKVKTNE